MDSHALDVQSVEVYSFSMALTMESFSNDRHAATYLSALEEYPHAFRGLLNLLNDPENEQRLVHAEELGHPALDGVVELFEGDPAIGPVVAAGVSGRRFRQAVGVAIRLKMAELGWITTGRKGVVRRGACFTKAERYTR